MREANKETIKQVTPSGNLLVETTLNTLDGQTTSVQFTNLCSYLQIQYRNGGHWHQLLSETMAKHNSQLNLVVYADEVTPGNVLAPMTARKCWAIFVSFKEFHQHLQCQDAWMTICVVRSSIVGKLDGHLSQLLKQILHHWFQVHFLHAQGLQLQEPSVHPQPQPCKRLFAKLGFFIMDGAAHKFAMSMKGDSGSRFCCLCKNVFLAKAQHEPDDVDHQVATVSSFTKHQDLQLSSDAEIWDSWARMSGRYTTLPANQFKKWEQATGITFSKDAILADRTLEEFFNPTQILFHDWMHAMLCQGVASSGIYKLVADLDCWSSLGGWLACWQVPSTFKNFKPDSLSSDKRVEKHKKSNKFSSTASELLTLLPLLDHFLLSVEADQTEHKDKVQCFQAMCLLVEQFQATWYQQAVTPSAIAAQVEIVLATWKATGWPMLKKHHWLLHVAKNFATHGILPNCFCMERKNKVVGQQATAIQNTTKLEQYILEELLAKELSTTITTNPFDTSITLVHTKAAPQKLQQWGQAIWPMLGHAGQPLLVSNSARIRHNANCTMGDVVLVETQAKQSFDAGQILCFLSFQGDSKCAIQLFALQHKGPKHCIWHETDKQVAVPLASVLAPVYWCKSQKGITTLTPFLWR